VVIGSQDKKRCTYTNNVIKHSLIFRSEKIVD